MKTLKNRQKQAIKFDRKCKNAEHKFYKQNINSETQGGGLGAVQY